VLVIDLHVCAIPFLGYHLLFSFLYMVLNCVLFLDSSRFVYRTLDSISNSSLPTSTLLPFAVVSLYQSSGCLTSRRRPFLWTKKCEDRPQRQRAYPCFKGLRAQAW
jgi:hypothetical protein